MTRVGSGHEFSDPTRGLTRVRADPRPPLSVAQQHRQRLDEIPYDLVLDLRRWIKNVFIRELEFL